MTMCLDRRLDLEGNRLFRTPAAFFAGDFPPLAATNGALVADGMRALGARPLTVAVGDDCWSVVRDGDTVSARPGAVDDALVVALTPDQFSQWSRNHISFNGFMVARALANGPEDRDQISYWDSLWLTLLSGWPAATPADLTFVGRDGAPLDLKQAFAPDDDPADIAHFLREAGYLRLKGWLDPDDMAAICAEMDAAMPSYAEGDGKSWWATLADGSRQCVRQQEFVDCSPTIRLILSGPVWERLRATIAAGEPLTTRPVEGRVIEALVKPVGVVAGPSDLTFHRDCTLGRHLYECSNATIGVVLTPSGRGNGNLQAIAGSHRVAMPVALTTRSTLPIVDLETDAGDLTVHLSCTLHASTAPVHAERRVMYTNMPMGQAEPEAAAALSSIREGVSDKLRDEVPVA